MLSGAADHDNSTPAGLGERQASHLRQRRHHMSGAYVRRLDHDVRLFVEFVTEQREVVRYSVTLTMASEKGRHTIRVYDSAHGFNEMHRHTRSGGKHAGERFHAGTLGEGMRAAITECTAGYRGMIEGWDR